MTSNIGSTQTIVTFLMQPSPGVFVESKRIFELEISQAAADHFSEMMAKLKENLDILALAVESGTLPDHNHEIGIVQGILAALDNWSKMIRINQQGEQVTTNPYFIPLQFDTSGAPIPGTGVRTDLPFYDTVAGTAVAIENSDCISNIDTTMTRYMAEARPDRPYHSSSRSRPYSPFRFCTRCDLSLIRRTKRDLRLERCH